MLQPHLTDAPNYDSFLPVPWISLISQTILVISSWGFIPQSCPLAYPSLKLLMRQSSQAWADWGCDDLGGLMALRWNWDIANHPLVLWGTGDMDTMGTLAPEEWRQTVLIDIQAGLQKNGLGVPFHLRSNSITNQLQSPKSWDPCERQRKRDRRKAREGWGRERERDRERQR